MKPFAYKRLRDFPYFALRKLRFATRNFAREKKVFRTYFFMESGLDMY